MNNNNNQQPSTSFGNKTDPISRLAAVAAAAAPAAPDNNNKRANNTKDLWVPRKVFTDQIEDETTTTRTTPPRTTTPLQQQQQDQRTTTAAKNKSKDLSWVPRKVFTDQTEEETTGGNSTSAATAAAAAGPAAAKQTDAAVATTNTATTTSTAKKAPPQAAAAAAQKSPPPPPVAQKPPPEQQPQQPQQQQPPPPPVPNVVPVLEAGATLPPFSPATQHALPPEISSLITSKANPCFYDMTHLPKGMEALDNKFWQSAELLKECFKSQSRFKELSGKKRSSKGTSSMRAYPWCVLFHCQTPQDRLIWINYWAGLSEVERSILADETLKRIFMSLKNPELKPSHSGTIPCCREENRKMAAGEIRAVLRELYGSDGSDLAAPGGLDPNAPQRRIIPVVDVNAMFAVFRDMESVVCHLGDLTCRKDMETFLPNILKGLETLAAVAREQQNVLVQASFRADCPYIQNNYKRPETAEEVAVLENATTATNKKKAAPTTEAGTDSAEKDSAEKDNAEMAATGKAVANTDGTENAENKAPPTKTTTTTKKKPSAVQELQGIVQAEIQSKRRKAAADRVLEDEASALRASAACDLYQALRDRRKQEDEGRNLMRGMWDYILTSFRITRNQLGAEQKRRTLLKIKPPKPKEQDNDEDETASKKEGVPMFGGKKRKREKKSKISPAADRKRKMDERVQARASEQAATESRIEQAVDKYLQVCEEHENPSRLPAGALTEILEAFQVTAHQLFAARRKRLGIPKINPNKDELEEKRATRARLAEACNAYFNALETAETDRLPHGAVLTLCEKYGISREQLKGAKKRRRSRQEQPQQERKRQAAPTRNKSDRQQQQQQQGEEEDQVEVLPPPGESDDDEQVLAPEQAAAAAQAVMAVPPLPPPSPPAAPLPEHHHHQHHVLAAGAAIAAQQNAPLDHATGAAAAFHHHQQQQQQVPIWLQQQQQQQQQLQAPLVQTRFTFPSDLPRTTTRSPGAGGHRRHHF